MARVWYYRKTRTKGVKSGCYILEWLAPNGEKMREPTQTKYKDVARQIAKQKEVELALDPWGLYTVKRVAKSWDEYVEDFLASKGVKRPGTVAAYRMSLAPVTRILSPKNVVEVATVAALKKFAAARVKEVSAQTVNKDLRTLRAALYYAEEQKHILKTPSFKDVWLSIDKKKPVCLSMDIQRQLLAAVVHADFRPRAATREWWGVFVMLAHTLGARRGEILGLTWQCVDFRERTVLIPAEACKTRQDRVLPLADADDLWLLLAKWREQATGDMVLPWGHATYRQFYVDWARLRKVAGVTGVVPKNLRSTAASEMVAAGVGTLTVKDWLGHTTVLTTESWYVDTDPALRQAAAQRQTWRGERS
ncbi:MAG: tyrosine-type recombinase/integrase [Pirellulaceae bacterium]